MKLEPKKDLRPIILVTISLLVIMYVVYEARFILYGPELTIFSPTNNLQTNSPLLNVTGKAKNISMLKVNGRPIMITPDNLFTDKLLLLPGYNRIEVKAQNKFNQEKSVILDIVLAEQKRSSTASSTESSTSTINHN
ncbi:MAG: hypothetical protein HY226_00905 [Candidatus Vogelbacteria bacterium]|nr:hypothetical protein [Candidatus Vogelbacteria bacterium]